ncbi:MAG: VanW family protein [Oscillospiraceae bacterium]|nr:VanW family protein [Oscillospiraceae bacterium]
MEKPIKRSRLRLALGNAVYGSAKRLWWLKNAEQLAVYRKDEPLEFECFRHKTPLLRQLKDVDMHLQHNKVRNLELATERLHGIVIQPGEIFSYWYLIGNPTRKRGYLSGMVLQNGKVTSGVGGGLCQLSNMIFWMALHSPLTVIERHRHGYDVFPDSNRTQPFGSGATCFYPHGDLMIRNDTEDTFQLFVMVGEEHLYGELRCDAPLSYRYEIEERNHRIQSEYWGGYTRENELYQKIFTPDGTPAGERLVVKNSAIMMYEPFLTEGQSREWRI